MVRCGRRSTWKASRKSVASTWLRLPLPQHRRVCLCVCVCVCVSVCVSVWVCTESPFGEAKFTSWLVRQPPRGSKGVHNETGHSCSTGTSFFILFYFILFFFGGALFRFAVFLFSSSFYSSSSSSSSFVFFFFFFFFIIIFFFFFC